MALAKEEMDTLQAESERLKERVDELETENTRLKLGFLERCRVIEMQLKDKEQLVAENKKHRWIPVSEKLPKGKGVWLVLKDGVPKCYRKNNESILWRGFVDTYSHWKPIILPGQAEKEPEANDGKAKE